MSTHSESASTHRASNSGGPARSRGNSVADCSKGTSIFTGKPNKELGDFTGSTSPDKSTPKPTAKPTTEADSKPSPIMSIFESDPEPTPTTSTIHSDVKPIPSAPAATTPPPTKPIDIPPKKMTPIHVPAKPINSKLPVLSSKKNKFVEVSLEDVPQKDGSGEGLKDWLSVPKQDDEWEKVSKEELGLKDDDDDKEKQGDGDMEKSKQGKKLTASGPWNVITYAGGTWNDPKWPRPDGQS